MAKIEVYRRIGVPLLLVMLLLASAASGCSSYSKYTLRNGAVKFSLEYPPSYLTPREYIDQSENPVGLGFDLRHSEEDPMRDAYIWVGVITPGEIFPDYRTSMEFDLRMDLSDQLAGLVERSPITVDSARGEQVVYPYTWLRVIEGSTELNKTAAITYAAYFEHNGFLWGIGVKSTAGRADEAKADFEHIVQSFRFLD